jgi:hypothetical protein
MRSTFDRADGAELGLHNPRRNSGLSHDHDKAAGMLDALVLVHCPGNSLRVRTVEDLLRSLHPSEGMLAGVPAFEEAADGNHKRPHPAEDTSLNRLAVEEDREAGDGLAGATGQRRGRCLEGYAVAFPGVSRRPGSIATRSDVSSAASTGSTRRWVYTTCPIDSLVRIAQPCLI